MLHARNSVRRLKSTSVSDVPIARRSGVAVHIEPQVHGDEDPCNKSVSDKSVRATTQGDEHRRTMGASRFNTKYRYGNGLPSRSQLR
jgi:hypothetical protein